MNNVVELNAVTRTYQRGRERIQAVNEVTFAVAPGEFVAIVGPSGSGKTTLLNLIGCVDTPDNGTVCIDGESTSGLNESSLTRIRARKIGFVFQQFFLLPTLTALENVQLPAMFLRNGDRSAEATKLLKRVGLGDRLHHLPGQLSGGEMQRVAIARALINSPRILLADEPTGSLDSENAASMLDLFAQLHAEGLTCLIVTHNEAVANACKRTIQMKDGRLAR